MGVNGCGLVTPSLVVLHFDFAHSSQKYSHPTPTLSLGQRMDGNPALYVCAYPLSTRVASD